MSDARNLREQDFWDVGVPPLARCLEEFHSGPDPNTALMLDALEPLRGAHVLDFACGPGITSAWLAGRGAIVTGLDISPRSLARARELCGRVGLTVRFTEGGIESLADVLFDRIAGRFALHHVDLPAVAPRLSQRLRVGGTAAFVETMDTNPVLRFARRRVVGRFGVRRVGTLDEHPLRQSDLRVLRGCFGHLELRVDDLIFLRLLDRQVLQYRLPAASRFLQGLDRLLLRQTSLRRMSYHQVIILTRTATG